MVQVLIKKKELEKPFVLEDIIILEELPAIEKEHEVVRVKAEEKPVKKVKKAFLKLFKKAKYNAKYHEELIPVENLKRQMLYRHRGVF